MQDVFGFVSPADRQLWPDDDRLHVPACHSTSFFTAYFRMLSGNVKTLCSCQLSKNDFLSVSSLNTHIYGIYSLAWQEV